jgi:kelch-like protein 20
MNRFEPGSVMERPPSPARLGYTSDKHPRHTLEAINVLRKHRELCDVVLIVGQKKIFAHRVILSACSPYFHAMFTGELAESRQTEVTIRDIDEVAMELLIDFCYTSSITVEESNVQTLLPAACLLHLQVSNYYNSHRKNNILIHSNNGILHAKDGTGKKKKKKKKKKEI